MSQNFQASFSVLVMSVASSAAVSMGLTANPQTGAMEKNKDMAQFNIDLLLVLQEKTKNNLNADEKKLLDNIVSDLQMKFVQLQ